MVAENHLNMFVRVANIVLIVTGIGCLFVLSYFVYHYIWLGDRQFTSLNGALLYYGLPFALAGLCLVALRWRPSYRLNIVFGLASTVVSLYAVEIVATIWFSLPSVIAEGPKRARMAVAKTLGVKYDPRTPLEVITDLRNHGVDAYPLFFPGDFLTDQAANQKQLFPLGSASNKVSVMCNESGEYVIYGSDQHGFHNPKGLWDKKAAQIVAVGDSFVQGMCVPSDKTFVTLIRNSHPATFNLGTSGHGPLLMLATIKEYAQYLKPQIVLWFYFEGNDLDDLKAERNSALLMRYMEHGFSQGLISRQPEIDDTVISHVATALNKSLLGIRLAELRKAASDITALYKKRKQILVLGQLRNTLGLIYGTGRLSHKNTQTKKPGKPKRRLGYDAEITLLGQILHHAKEVVGKWGGNLYFVYLPDWHRYAQPEHSGRNRDEVLLLAQSVGLPVIDLHPVFQSQEDPLDLFPFRQHSHYNEEGNRLVAEAVLKGISLGLR